MTCDEVFDVLTRGPFPSGARDEAQVEDHLGHCQECRRLAMALRPAVELFQEAVGPDESCGLPGYHGRLGRPAAGSLSEDLDEVSADNAAANGVASGGREELSRRDALKQRPTPWSAIRATWGTPRPHAPALAGARAGSSRANLLRFAAALLVGVAAAAGSRGLMNRPTTSVDGPSDPVPPGLVQGSAADDANSREARKLWLAGLVLPPSCAAHDGESAEAKKPAAEVLSGLQLAAVDRASRLDCCTDCHSSANPGLLPAEAQSLVARACRACH